MSEDTLITALEEEALSQAGRILEEARSAAGNILSDASAEVSSERDRRSRELDSAMKGRKASLLNASATRASGAGLAVRRGLIEETLAEAVKRFSLLPEEEYRKFLNQLFFELKEEWEKHRPGEVPVALVNPADIGLVETEFELKADESVILGVVLATIDGLVRFENTVASRLSKAKAAMTPAINEMLFDGVFE